MFDMDGVLCDLTYWAECYNALKEDGRIDWEMIIKNGSSFWANMPWTKEGKRLYNDVVLYMSNHPNVEIGIHSAIDIPCGKLGKYEWVKNNCPEIAERNVKIDENGHLKYLTGEANEILIDDRMENVRSYIQAGFPAILFTSAEETFRKTISIIEDKRFNI